MVKIIISPRFCRFKAILLGVFAVVSAAAQPRALVIQTDFGLKDGAVSAMKGVAFGVSAQLPLFDLTHEIPAYNIWEAAYRLEQAYAYWPEGTVFVSVVDPGVGSSRRSVVARLKSGHFVVTPDNGTLTLLAGNPGIDTIRQIDETRNRLPGSSESYTFHGRDVYAYTGARLAAGIITFSEIGPLQTTAPVTLPFTPAGYSNGLFEGSIPVLDVQYGNVWTNIPLPLLRENGVNYGDSLAITIYHDKKKIYTGRMLFGTTFSAVKAGKPVAYVNSLLQLSFGLNRGNFAATHRVSSGPGWRVTVQKQRTDHSREKDSPGTSF